MIIKLYSRALNKHPFLTQVLSTGVLMGAGDIISQTLVEKRSIFKKNFVYARTVRFFGLGCLFVAPPMRAWYVFLERYVHVRKYPKLTPLLRVVLDQSLFAPVTMSAFLIVLRKLEGSSLDSAIQKWRRDFLDIFVAGLKLWPAAQLINFYFVPLNYRIVFVQTIALAWNTYLAWRTNQSGPR